MPHILSAKYVEFCSLSLSSPLLLLLLFISIMIIVIILIVGLQQSVIVSAQPYGLPLNETIFPQYLKPFGYATHIVGKVCGFLYTVTSYV